jgi:hypothetical protein
VTDTLDTTHALQHDAAPGRGDKWGISCDSNNIHRRRDTVGQQGSHCPPRIGWVRSPSIIEQRAVERSSSCGQQVVLIPACSRRRQRDRPVIGREGAPLEEDQAVFPHEPRPKSAWSSAYGVFSTESNSEVVAMFGRASGTDSRVRRSLSVGTALRGDETHCADEPVEPVVMGQADTNRRQ